MAHDYDKIAQEAGWVMDENQIWFHPTLSPDLGYIETRILCEHEGLIPDTQPTPKGIPLMQADWSPNCQDAQYIDYTGQGR